MPPKQNNSITNSDVRVLASRFDNLEDKVDEMRTELRIVANNTVSKDWLELKTSAMQKELDEKASKVEFETYKKLFWMVSSVLVGLVGQTLFDLFKG